MPPLVNDYCTVKSGSPQIHAWSGDLWLETASERDTLLYSPIKHESFSDSSLDIYDLVIFRIH